MKLAPGSLIVLLVSICVACTAIWGAKAQTNKPISQVKMIVPYGKGGGSDQLSRAMAESIESISNTRFNVINIKKGAGLGAVPEFMKLPADGYTVIEHIDDIAAGYAVGATAVHPGRDWQPLAIVQLTFSQLFIRSDDNRFSDWKSFVAFARKNPKNVVIANVSYDGSMENLTMRKLESALGIKTRQVSFDNIKDRYEAVFQGRADALFEQPGDVRSYSGFWQAQADIDILQHTPPRFCRRADPQGGRRQVRAVAQVPWVFRAARYPPGTLGLPQKALRRRLQDLVVSKIQRKQVHDHH